MSTTNNLHFVDFQGKYLHAEKIADVIQNKIRHKCVAEANRIFQELASDLKKGDREKISKQLSFLLEQAENYFREADILETERKLEQAREKYKKVKNIAIDYPGLPEALKRLDDTIALVGVLEHRAKRRTRKKDKQSASLTTSSQASLTTSSQSGRFRGWLPLLVCFALLIIMFGAGLFYIDNLNLTFTEKKTVVQVAPLEDDEYFKVKDSVSLQINEKTEQPVPFLQMEEKIGHTSRAEDEFTIRQDNQSTTEIALKSEKTTGEKSTLQMQDQVANNPDGLQVGMPLVIPTFSETNDVLLSPSFSISLSLLNGDGTYTVQSGDSLGIIAQKLFGNTWKWEKIYELNNDVLISPHILKVGQKLRIKASGPFKEETNDSSELAAKPEKEFPSELIFWFGEDQRPINDIDSQ